ncbi:hypothetical protein [Halobacterium sp. KA-6]|uniref:hypothetical protein n=1 Tax=Halobacterium sp. KA-6 TaxID=2896368 RepID=UPI001E6259F2|nr:hypothetical protein [Halobacterium sp. KA-6]MCD2204430.1 hypothetical protein [Halobacterium sp. KA-6]
MSDNNDSNENDAEDGRGGPHASEDMTVAELLALCGSANHDSGDKTLNDLLDALGEAHPAVAGKLVERQRLALDESTGEERGTASASEHPEWHDSLKRSKQASDARWPDE